MKKGLFIAGLTLPSLVLSTTTNQNYKIHILKPGETLSELLQHENYKPLYGEGHWVDKVLEMNHLSAEQALKLKKGYPIILPSKEDLLASTKTDEVKVSQASTMFHGLVGNTISKHQDIFLDFGYFQTASQLNNKTITQLSNFKVGLTYQDNNKRTYKKFSYNPQVSFYGIGHGPAEFSGDSSKTATFEPTLQAQTSLIISHPSVSYQFGPYLEALERSQVESLEDTLEVRRDRFLNVGAMAQQRFEIDHLVYDFKASIGSTLASQNLNDYETMRMVTTKFSADVNLTRDYFVGVFWRGDNFANSSQSDASSIGFNLKYFVK